MQELIIVTILPAFVILTAFLFNIGTKETIDFKYGLNMQYFNPIAVIMVFQYATYSFGGLVIVKLVKNEVIVDLKHGLILATMVIIVGIYYIMRSIFTKKRDMIFIKSDQCESNERKHYSYLLATMLLIAISSFITIIILYSELQLAINMLITKYEDTDHFFLMSLFVALFICYSFTMIAAGYLHNYGQLFNFKKYRLIFAEEFKVILSELKIQTEKNAIDVYVLVETEESMRIKIDKENLPSIIIKKEHILNLLLIDESRTTVQEGSTSNEEDLEESEH